MSGLYPFNRRPYHVQVAKEEKARKVCANASVSHNLNYETMFANKRRRTEADESKEADPDEDAGDEEDTQELKDKKKILKTKIGKQWAHGAATSAEFIELLRKKQDITDEEKAQKEQRAADKVAKEKEKGVERLRLVAELKEYVVKDDGRWRVRQGGGGKILKGHLEAVLAMFNVKPPETKYTEWMSEVQQLLHWDAASKKFL